MLGVTLDYQSQHVAYPRYRYPAPNPRPNNAPELDDPVVLLRRRNTVTGDAREMYPRFDPRMAYPLPRFNEDDWNFVNDNRFALDFFESLELLSASPLLPQPSILCSRCQNLDFQSKDLKITDDFIELELRSSHCAFCRMLLSTGLKYSNSRSKGVKFIKTGSHLMINDRGESLLVLSICSTPGA